MIPVTPRLAGSNIDLYIEHLNAINEMLAEEGKLDEDLDDAFETAQAIANTRKSKTTD